MVVPIISSRLYAIDGRDWPGSASTTVRRYGRLAMNNSEDPGSSSECSNGVTRGFLGESAGADSRGHQGANDSYIFINHMIGP